MGLYIYNTSYFKPFLLLIILKHHHDESNIINIILLYKNNSLNMCTKHVTIMYMYGCTHISLYAQTLEGYSVCAHGPMSFNEPDTEQLMTLTTYKDSVKKLRDR